MTDGMLREIDRIIYKEISKIWTQSRNAAEIEERGKERVNRSAGRGTFEPIPNKEELRVRRGI